MSSEKIKAHNVADELKQIYGINKNISESLSKEQKKELLMLLENNETVLNLTRSFVTKNNRQFGKQRETAKRNLVDEQERNNDLNTQVSQLKYELKELKISFLTCWIAFTEC